MKRKLLALLFALFIITPVVLLLPACGETVTDVRASGGQILFEIDDEFTTGADLVVEKLVGETWKPAEDDLYIIDSSAYDKTAVGAYPIKIDIVDTELSYTYYVAVVESKTLTAVCGDKLSDVELPSDMAIAWAEPNTKLGLPGTANYAVRITAAANYTITANISVTVTGTAVEKPTITNVTYNGSDQTAVAINEGYTVSNNTNRDAGTYNVGVSLKRGYYWSDNTSADLSLQFVISKVKLTKPTITGTYTFNNTLRTVLINNLDETNTTITGNRTRTNAGSEEITISINDKTNYQWIDGTDADVELLFVIARAQIAKPTISTTNPIYNGSKNVPATEHTAIVTGYDSVTMTRTGEVTRTNAGSQTITYAITDKTNYEWSGGTNDQADVELVFTVNHATATRPTGISNNNLVYDGEEKVAVITGFDNETMVMANQTRTNVGTQKVTVGLFDADNYYWAGTTNSEAVEFDFVIVAQKIEKPTRIVSSVYTGEEITLTPASLKFDENVYDYAGKVTLSGNKKTDVGTYDVTVTLADNYIWKDDASASITLSWQITQAEVAKPTGIEETYTFNYLNQTLSISDLVWAGTDDDLIKFAAANENDGIDSNIQYDAGTYSLKVLLTDTANYKWAGDNQDDPTLSWVIGKLSVAKPTAVERTYTFNGVSQDYEITGFDTDTMTKVGDLAKIGAGNYSATIALKDTANTNWADNSISALEFSWSIEKAVVGVELIGTFAIEKYYDGTNYKKVSLELVAFGNSFDIAEASQALYTAAAAVPGESLVFNYKDVADGKITFTMFNDENCTTATTEIGATLYTQMAIQLVSNNIKISDALLNDGWLYFTVPASIVKQQVSVTGTVTATNINIDTALSTSSISGVEASVNYAETPTGTPATVAVDGTWAWKNAAEIVSTMGQITRKAVFIPNDATHYDGIEVDVTLTVVDPYVGAIIFELAGQGDDQHYLASKGEGTIPSELTIPATYCGKPVQFAENAFVDCSEITSLIISEGITAIPHNCFKATYATGAIASVTLPSTLISIGTEAFFGQNNLREVVIPSSVTTFNGFNDLKVIVYVEGKASSADFIGTNNVFGGDNVMYYLGASGTYKNSVFTYNDGENDIFKYILVGEDAVVVRGVSANATVEIPAATGGDNSATIVKVGDQAFYLTSTLTTIKVQAGDNVVIGNRAFEGCGLVAAYLDGAGGVLGKDVICNNADLTTFVIGQAVTDLGLNTLTGTGATIYFCGTQADWEGIGKSSAGIDGADVYFFHAGPTAPTSGNNWHYVEGVVTVWENRTLSGVERMGFESIDGLTDENIDFWQLTGDQKIISGATVTGEQFNAIIDLINGEDNANAIPTWENATLVTVENENEIPDGAGNYLAAGTEVYVVGQGEPHTVNGMGVSIGAYKISSDPDPLSIRIMGLTLCVFPQALQMEAADLQTPTFFEDYATNGNLKFEYSYEPEVGTTVTETHEDWKVGENQYYAYTISVAHGGMEEKTEIIFEITGMDGESGASTGNAYFFRKEVATEDPLTYSYLSKTLTFADFLEMAGMIDPSITRVEDIYMNESIAAFLYFFSPAYVNYDESEDTYTPWTRQDFADNLYSIGGARIDGETYSAEIYGDGSGKLLLFNGGKMYIMPGMDGVIEGITDFTPLVTDDREGYTPWADESFGPFITEFWQQMSGGSGGDEQQWFTEEELSAFNLTGLTKLENFSSPSINEGQLIFNVDNVANEAQFRAFVEQLITTFNYKYFYSIDEPLTLSFVSVSSTETNFYANNIEYYEAGGSGSPVYYYGEDGSGNLNGSYKALYSADGSSAPTHIIDLNYSKGVESPGTIYVSINEIKNWFTSEELSALNISSLTSAPVGSGRTDNAQISSVEGNVISGLYYNAIGSNVGQFEAVIEQLINSNYKYYYDNSNSLTALTIENYRNVQTVYNWPYRVEYLEGFTVSITFTAMYSIDGITPPTHVASITYYVENGKISFSIDPYSETGEQPPQFLGDVTSVAEYGESQLSTGAVFNKTGDHYYSITGQVTKANEYASNYWGAGSNRDYILGIKITADEGVVVDNETASVTLDATYYQADQSCEGGGTTIDGSRTYAAGTNFLEADGTFIWMITLDYAMMTADNTYKMFTVSIKWNETQAEPTVYTFYVDTVNDYLGAASALETYGESRFIEWASLSKTGDYTYNISGEIFPSNSTAAEVWGVEDTNQYIYAIRICQMEGRINRETASVTLSATYYEPGQGSGGMGQTFVDSRTYGPGENFLEEDGSLVWIITLDYAVDESASADCKVFTASIKWSAEQEPVVYTFNVTARAYSSPEIGF